MTENNHTCLVCKTQFKPVKGKSNKFCGMSCYRISQKRGDYKGLRDTVNKYNCSHCGNTVLNKSKSRTRSGDKSDKIFCNRDCYDSYRSKIKEQTLRNCLQCNSEIKASLGHNSNQIYCSIPCKNEHKKSKDRNCIVCGVWFSSLKWNASAGGLVADNARKTCSNECYIENIKSNQDRKEKISKAFTGSNHPNWQGGYSFLDRGFRGSDWENTRILAIKKAGYICEHCGISEVDNIKKNGRGLSVNHKIPFHQFGGMNKLANKLSNLEALCDSCHSKADWRYRKENQIQMILNF